MLSILIFFLNSTFSSSQSILYLLDAANLGCNDSYSLEVISISIPFFTNDSAAFSASGKGICKDLDIRSGVNLPFFTMRRKVLDSSVESFSSELRTPSRRVISADNSYNHFKSFFKIVFSGLPINNTKEHYSSSHAYSLKLDSTGSTILQERSSARGTCHTSRQTLEFGERYRAEYDYFVVSYVRIHGYCCN